MERGSIPRDFIESGMKPAEHILINPTALLEDNRSPEARENVSAWMENYHSGQTYILRDCADARQLVDLGAVSEQSSISSSFPHKEEYSRLYNAPGVKGVVNQTHFDGQTFVDGQRPQGCGGQDAKDSIEKAKITPTLGVTEWVNRNVTSPDPLVNSLIQARETARHFEGKKGRMFVVTQDHRRGLLIPVGEWTTTNGVERRVIPLKLRGILEARTQKELEKLYDPERIYDEGIPSVPEDELSDDFREYLEKQTTLREKAFTKYPDFTKRTGTQNPDWFVISDSKIPFQIRYPHTFLDFDSAFRIHLPRIKSEQSASIQDLSQMSGVDQMHYAVEHSILNHGDPKKPFSKAHSMLVETADMNLSSEIVRRLLSRRWMRDWIALPDHQLFQAESRGGQTLQVQEV